MNKKRQIKSSKCVRIDLPPEDEFEDYLNEEGRDYSFHRNNEAGLVTELIRFNDYGDRTGKSLYFYDEKNLLSGEETYDEEENLEEKITFDRDADGRIIREFIHYLDDSRDTIHYEYNSQGNVIRKVTMTEDNETEREEIFEWDDDKLLTEELIEEGETVKKSSYEYDDSGNLIAVEMENEDEESSVANEYDERGNRIKYLKYDSEGKLVEKHLFTYDEKNRVIEITEEDRIKKNTVQILYDELGNAIRQTETNRDGGINHSLERDYDEDGNITIVRAAIGGTPERPARKYILSYRYEFF